MRKIIICSFLILLFAGNLAYAQDNYEKQVRETIESFFTAFHQKDTSKIRSLAADEIVLQTMGSNREGQFRLRVDTFEDFLSSLTSIPDSLDFREEILEYEIKVDLPMAHAWTPYDFKVNGRRSHCGVNSFQLFNDGSSWKIIYLADTRRREGCGED